MHKIKVFTVITFGSKKKTVQRAKQFQIYLPRRNRLIASPNKFLTVHRYKPELPVFAVKVTFVIFDIQSMSLFGDVQSTVGAGLPIPRHENFTSVSGSRVRETFAGLMTAAAS